MPASRRIAVLAGSLLGAVVLAFWSGPWLLYAVALSKVDGRPEPPASIALSKSDAEAEWRAVREPLPIRLEPTAPHALIVGMLTDGEWVASPGSRMAGAVAMAHNRGHPVPPGWWHPAGAALTIWLTRNWTAEQLVAKAHELRFAEIEEQIRARRLRQHRGTGRPPAE